MAEKRLEQIRDSLRIVSDVQNMDATNPIVTRISNTTVRRVTTVVCATREPYNEILPLNVIWFDFNPASAYYNEARRRVSKTEDVSNGTTHTWEVIDTMAEFEEDQFYDDEDAGILNSQTPLPVASTTTLGVAKLSVAPQNAAAPVAVGEGDPRLSDARKPLDHSHAEVPATQLQAKTGIVTIKNSSAPVAGAVLIATSPTTAVWRPLTSNDIAK